MSGRLRTGPSDPLATLVLAHGAGAPMDAPAMTAFAAALGAAGLAVHRFDFAYMADRKDGGRRPPPPIARLVPEFQAALDGTLAETAGPVLVGGKSMGGRVATMLAGGPLDPRVVGAAVYGYPFHPPGAPEKTRLEPIRACRLPLTICQGTRDPFGGRDDVAGYALPAGVELVWFEDGDHDLSPRKASGFTAEGHLAGAAAAIAAAVRRIVGTG